MADVLVILFYYCTWLGLSKSQWMSGWVASSTASVRVRKSEAWGLTTPRLASDPHETTDLNVIKCLSILNPISLCYTLKPRSLVFLYYKGLRDGKISGSTGGNSSGYLPWDANMWLPGAREPSSMVVTPSGTLPSGLLPSVSQLFSRSSVAAARLPPHCLL